MDALKIAVGIAFAVFAAHSCTLAMAEDLGQPLAASFRPADPPSQGVLLAATPGENDNCVGPDNRSQAALSTLVPASDAASGQQQSAAPSIANSQGNCLCGCLGPLCSCNPCPCFYFDVEALFMLR